MGLSIPRCRRRENSRKHNQQLYQRLIDEVFWLWGGSASGCGCVGTLHAEHDDAVRYPA
jgi:hypothetical protein